MIKKFLGLIGIVLLFSLLLVTNIARAGSIYSDYEAMCRNTDTALSKEIPTKTTSFSQYPSHFYYGCKDYFYFRNDGLDFICPSSMMADQYAACKDGYMHGEQILTQKAEALMLTVSGKTLSTPCSEMAKDKALSTLEKDRYASGCEIGYTAGVLEVVYTYSAVCNPSDPLIERYDGCRDGHKAAEDLVEFAASLNQPLDFDSIDTTSEIGSYCSKKADARYSRTDEPGAWQAYYNGCDFAYRNTVDYPEDNFAYAKDRYAHLGSGGPSPLEQHYFDIYKNAYSGTMNSLISSLSYNPETSGLVPDCDPTLPPGSPANENGLGPCGLSAAEQLIKNIIKFLFWIVIPLAAIMIGLGGFTIMTAAGSPEKVKKGTGMITIALTGIAIMAVAYLIVQFVFGALGVSQTIVDDIFK